MLAVNFTPFPRLTTERLIFRQLKAGDEGEIFKLRSDKNVNKYLTRNGCKTMEEAGAFINKINRGISNNESIYWGIAQKKDNIYPGDKLIGTICLWNIQPEDYRAELGYELNPDFWGKGIMSEAIPKIIEYGFEIMKLHSLEADLDPGNSRSALLLEKNGFMREGYFKESVYFNGKFLDRVVYTLLNPARNSPDQGLL
jgi:ribosomal-protein-alanine N-acetyltransferase